MQSSQRSIIGWSLIVIGVLGSEPLLGKYLGRNSDIVFPLNVLAAFISIFLVCSGACILAWRRPIGKFARSGKEAWFRLVAVSLPIIAISALEFGLYLIEGPAPQWSKADRHAHDLMEAGFGKVRYKGLALFEPSANPLFRINSLGFRTYEFDEPRGDEIRIMLLGGSTSFGWPVSDRDTIGRHLEDYLSEAVGRPVKVYNLGVPGARFAQEESLLEDFADVIEPELVVFYHGANDGLGWYHRAMGRSESSQDLVPRTYSLDVLLHYVLQLSLFQRIQQFANMVLPAEGADKIDISEAVSAYGETLSKASRHCVATACMYVLQPIIFQKKKLTYHEVRQQGQTAAKAPQLGAMYMKYVDAIMTRRFANHFDASKIFYGTEGHIFNDGLHIMGEGNRMIAQFIARAICEQRVLTCSHSASDS